MSKKPENLKFRATKRLKSFLEKRAAEIDKIENVTQYITHLATLDGYEPEPSDW